MVKGKRELRERGMTVASVESATISMNVNGNIDTQEFAFGIVFNQGFDLSNSPEQIDIYGAMVMPQFSLIGVNDTSPILRWGCQLETSGQAPVGNNFLPIGAAAFSSKIIVNSDEPKVKLCSPFRDASQVQLETLFVMLPPYAYGLGLKDYDATIDLTIFYRIK